MDPIYKMTCVVYVASDEDPEEVASEFNRGFSPAVRGFPAGDVLYTDVERIERAPENEIDEHELREE